MLLQEKFALLSLKANVKLKKPGTVMPALDLSVLLPMFMDPMKESMLLL